MANTNEDLFSNFNPNKTYEEEFNPFHFLDKIDRSKLTLERSNTDWKLHIDYIQYYQSFEDSIKNLNNDIHQRELEQKERINK